VTTRCVARAPSRASRGCQPESNGPGSWSHCAPAARADDGQVKLMVAARFEGTSEFGPAAVQWRRANEIDIAGITGSKISRPLRDAFSALPRPSGLEKRRQTNLRVVHSANRVESTVTRTLFPEFHPAKPMKAVRIHRYGDASVLQLDEVPRPKLLPRDVRIRVCATSVNPVDWKIRSGGQRNIIPLKLPWILGLDVSGVVTEIGPKVQHFRVGDEVWSSPTHLRPGTYAEEVCIDESEVARKPQFISHDEAASLPLVALTAYQCVAEAGLVQSGQTALIHAGAGGVGTVAIQIAKYLGARVITTCSARNVAFVKSLGADQVIDYTKIRVENAAANVDFILDSLGEPAFESNLNVIRRGGRIANITLNVASHVERHGPLLGTLTLAGSFVGMLVKPFVKKNVCVQHVIKRGDGIMLEQIADLVDLGAIKPVIDTVFPLELVREAHRYSESRHVRGKIVLHIANPSS